MHFPVHVELDSLARLRQLRWYGIKKAQSALHSQSNVAH